MVTSFSKLKENEGFSRVPKIPTPLSKRLYSLKEAAEYLGRSEWGMRELIWAGRIPVVRPDRGRKIFLDIEDLNTFIDQTKSVYR